VVVPPELLEVVTPPLELEVVTPPLELELVLTVQPQRQLHRPPMQLSALWQPGGQGGQVSGPQAELLLELPLLELPFGPQLWLPPPRAQAHCQPPLTQLLLGV
jgi:hypothetical protein